MTLESPTDGLVLIDVQRGFVNEHTAPALPALIDQLHSTQRRGQPIVATRFINVDGSLYRSHLDWHLCGPNSADTALAPGLEHLEPHTLTKLGYASAGALPERCRALGMHRPLMVGFHTDSCVLACAVELFDHGIWPRIAATACASTGGPRAHQAGLDLMRRMLGPHALI